MATRVSRATAEQAAAAREISTAVDSMRAQTEQAARAGKDQAGAMREMSAAAQNTVKQLKLISAANREHSTVAASLLTSLAEVRVVSDRNVRRVRLGTTSRSNGRSRGR